MNNINPQEQEPNPQELKQEPQEEPEISQEDAVLDSIEKELDEAPPQEVKEPAAPPKKKDKKQDKDIVDERFYTIPLGKALIMPPRKRAPRAMRMIREFIIKHLKMPTRPDEDEDEIPRLILTNKLNQKMWEQGIEKPPRKIRVRATKDKEGNVTVDIAQGD